VTTTFDHQDWAEAAEWLLLKPRQAAIDLILERLGVVLGVDRTWIIRYNDSFTHFWNIHEWVRPGVPKFVQDLQGIPVSLCHWLNTPLQRGETIAITDLSELPRSANALRKEWERQEIRSLLAAPGLWEGKLSLQVGFDTVHERRVWTPGDIDVLKAITRLLTAALCGNPVETESKFPPRSPVTPRAVLRRASAYESKSPDDIVLIRAAGDYSRLHFRNGSEAMELRSLKYWETNLPQEIFCRCHRSALVNLRAIRELSRTSGRWELHLEGIDDPVPVGRQYRAVLKHHLVI
jgi:hypothetical protein